MMNKYIAFLVFWLYCTLFSTLSLAQTRYVSDQIEATLRTGPSLGHAVQRMLRAGVALEVLEEDPKSGYTRVKTSSGVEGWLLSRYLMAEPDARSQVEKFAKQINTSADLDGSVRAQLNAIKEEYENARKRITVLESTNKRLESELDSIRKTSANVLSIDKENKKLQQKLAVTEESFLNLQTENNELGDRKQRDWFVAGALVLLGGIVLGLILPRFAKRRHSRYDSY